MQLIVGVDTGGTFTDFVLVREGRIEAYKVLSTPDDPASGILAGLSDLGVGEELAAIVHGTTVATNAVLEHKGAKTGLITTAGFRDVLEIGRQTRPKLYDLRVQRIPPLVPASLRTEVHERLDERGGVLTPLSHDSVSLAVNLLVAAGVESVAICLLFSFANPAHEQAVADAARRAGLNVSESNVVLPEFREYERTSTVVLNAYVAPILSRYLKHLESELPSATSLRVMQSNGGSISAETARCEAARTLLSGPAGGVVGAAYVARASGVNRLITLDMGGTSTDVALVNEEIAETTSGQIGGYPTRLPMIDIHTVGAGGGSIAWFDTGGALRVGPGSAGADPGPAAYGRGGTCPTVTDANVILGRLVPDRFLGGRMTLDVSSARVALDSVAHRLQTSIEEAALGILRIANANMEAAIRVISVERGHDPRQLTLVAFGGAGPLHACELADALHIPRVLIPTKPGVLSALGMLAADVLKDYVRTIMLDPSAAVDVCDSIFPELDARGRTELEREGVTPSNVIIEHHLDIRYLGQSYELTVPYAGSITETIDHFHSQHERRFGYCMRDANVQIVNLRVKARGHTVPPKLERRPVDRATDAEPQLVRAVVFRCGGHCCPYETPIFEREWLMPGARIGGPAIFTQPDTTTVLPPHWSATVDDAGNLIARPV